MLSDLPIACLRPHASDGHILAKSCATTFSPLNVTHRSEFHQRLPKREHVPREALAKSDLDKIRVVPNPYVVTNEFEPINYYDQGRGDRAIHFVNLPTQCTIRIYTVSGQLIDVIEHDTDIYGRGEVVWDMMSKENMDIGFGVYVYHVDAGKLGKKMGKFAIIK